MEDVGGTLLQKLGAMAEERTPRHKVRLGTTGRFEPARAGPGVHPRTLQPSALTAGPMLDRLGAAQTTRHTPGFQGLTQWHPIHPGGGQRSRLDVTVHAPIRPGVKRSGLGPKGAPQRWGVAVRHAGHHLLRAHSHPSGGEVDWAHPGAWVGVALGGACTRACAALAHRGLLRRARSITAAASSPHRGQRHQCRPHV